MTGKVFNEYMLIFKVNYGLDFQKNEEHAAYCRMIRSRLEDFPDDAVKKAFEFVLNNCPWLPKWADFAKALELAGSPRGKALVQWHIVLGMLRTNADLRGRFFQLNKASERAIRALGGWHQLGLMRVWDLNQMGPAFEAAYLDAAAQGFDRQLGRVEGEKIKDYVTGATLPLIEIQLSEPVNALPEPEYLEDRPTKRNEPIALEYQEDIGRLARKRAMP